jgi:hypothetical protein
MTVHMARIQVVLIKKFLFRHTCSNYGTYTERTFPPPLGDLLNVYNTQLKSTIQYLLLNVNPQCL